jgi:23S rRNA A2030 N6-methylase RlmJ
MIVVNPPWKLDESLARLLPALCADFGATGSGRARVETLVPE